MRRIILAAAMLGVPGMSMAADSVSTTGVWKIDGDVMGTPVKMTCRLTEAEQTLSGSCAGAQDNYAPHRLSGKVKAGKVDFHFETAMQGSAISVIVSGTLSEDGSKMSGELDVEPMQASGSFAAARVMEDAPAAATAAAVVDVGAAATGISAPAAAETWKVDGDVQGTPVVMTCAIAQAAGKLSGTCTGAAGDMEPKKLTGEATETGLKWQFDTTYDGNPITVAMNGTKSADGAKMNGTIAVSPMGVDGTFSAAKQ